MVNLYRRDNSPYWWAQATLKGKTMRWSTKERDKAKAQVKALEEYSCRVKLMTTSEGHGMSLEACLDRYVSSYMGTPGATFDNIRYRADKILGRRKGRTRGKVFSLNPKLPMAKLTTQHVASLREHRQREGMSNASINAELRCLQRAYTLARDEWGVPVSGVLFRSLKTRPKTRYLQPAEVRAVRDRLSGRALGLFEVLLGSGVRLKEATGLEWDQIDLETGRVEVYRPKTGRFDMVPLSDKAKAVLRTLKEQPRPFVNEGDVIRELREAIHKVCNKDPRKEKATIHSLRDTFASGLVQRGMSLYQVSRLLGHSSLSMTQKYAHLEMGGLVDDARRLINDH